MVKTTAHAINLFYRALSPDGEVLAQGRGTFVYREVDGERKEPSRKYPRLGTLRGQ